MRAVRGAALAALLVAAACGGERGTFEVSAVAAPGSDLLGRIQTLRATLSDPHHVVESERGADGTLSLSLEVDADDRFGALTLEGFDAAGERIALGLSGPLPIGAVDAQLTVYLAPPLSMAAAPVALDPPRASIGATRLSYGAVLAGGRGPDGAPLRTFEVYGLYDHALSQGETMPAGRAAPTVFAGSIGFVYLLGGEAAGGEASGDAYAFDSTALPRGQYIVLPSDDAFARVGADAAALGNERFLVAGAPGLVVDGLLRRIDPAPGDGALDGTATTVVDDGGLHALVAGDGVEPGGAALVGATGRIPLDAPAELRRSGHRAIGLAGGDVLVVGGERAGVLEASAVVYRAGSRSFEVLPDFLATPRAEPAVAATEDYLLVAGGRRADGSAAPDVELFAAGDLAAAATLPLVVPRAEASAVALGNGQVLIAGGADDAGAPIGVLELFTPDAAPPR